MSVTIQTEPSLFNPAYNRCEFTFSSTLTGQTNFSFFIKLYVNGSYHSAHEVVPENGIYGRWNASQILRSIVYTSLVVDGTLTVNASSTIASYYIEVYDKYGTIPEVQVTGSATSSTINAFNSSLRQNDWIAFNYLDYDIINTASALFLTTFPRTESYYCGLTESMYLGYIASNGTSVDINVKLYDSAGSLLYTATPVAVTNSKTGMIDVSPSTIITNTTLTSGNFDEAYYYTVQLTQTTKTTEIFKIYIDRECSKYSSYRLHWLNKFGVWESYTFNKYSEESTDLSITRHEKEGGAWNGSNQHVYSTQDTWKGITRKVANDKLTLNSDWIKQDKHNWIVRELYESPLVYLESSFQSYEYVLVSNANYTLKQRSKLGLLNETVTIERTNQYKSQLG